MLARKLSASLILFLLGLTIPLAGVAQQVNNSAVASAQVADKPPQDLPTYTLISTVDMKTSNGLSCEIAVAMAVDRSDVRVIRLDPRKGVYSVNYFAKKPALFAHYGQQYLLQDEVDLKGQKVTTVAVTMDFENEQRDVILHVNLDDGKVLEKRLHLDHDFFKDNAQKCLK